MTKYLFICIGNAMRSQMAEGFFNHYNKNKSDSCVSAGIDRHGYVIPEVIDVMKEKGIDITHHTSDQVTDEMIREADKIVVFAKEAVHYFPKEKMIIKLVKDPYHDSNTLRPVRDEIEGIVKGIVTKG